MLNQKENQYFNFNINRILLLAVGLWPYQQSNFTKLQYIFISVILTAIILFQLTTFLTLKCTLDLFMKILSSASFCAIFVIKYNVFYFNIESVKDLLTQLQHVHNKIKDQHEIAIIKEYDYIARRYTILITTLICFGIFVSILLQFWINMDNIDLSMNASRSYNFLFPMEYFVDQEKYFYFIVFHVNAALCFGAISLTAIGTMLIAYIQHICGMFRIASYRIKYAINKKILQNTMLKNNIWMIEVVIYAVDIHRQAIKLAKHLMSILVVMMFGLVICSVASLSLNLFQMTLFKNDFGKMIMPFGYVIVCVIYMYMANLMGQIVIDHNNQIFITAYSVHWYETPLYVQKMILFLLQIGFKQFSLNIGGLIHASMECFALLMKTSLSYFTVMYSTQ